MGDPKQRKIEATNTPAGQILRALLPGARRRAREREQAKQWEMERAQRREDKSPPTT